MTCVCVYGCVCVGGVSVWVMCGVICVWCEWCVCGVCGGRRRGEGREERRGVRGGEGTCVGVCVGGGGRGRGTVCVGVWKWVWGSCEWVCVGGCAHMRFSLWITKSAPSTNKDTQLRHRHNRDMNLSFAWQDGNADTPSGTKSEVANENLPTRRVTRNESPLRLRPCATRRLDLKPRRFQLCQVFPPLTHEAGQMPEHQSFPRDLLSARWVGSIKAPVREIVSGLIHLHGYATLLELSAEL